MKTTEQIIARNLADPSKAFPMNRSKFYSEQIAVFKKTGSPTKAVDIVDIFLFNEEKELFVQKRSRDKLHNPKLLDKSLGGHVKYGDSVNFTAMVETVQELQVPSIVLRSMGDFCKTYFLLSSYLNTVSLLFHVDSKIIHIPKVFNGEKVAIANNVHIFAGIYSGRIKTVDREATGVLQYALLALREEMEELPDQFTDDLHILLEKYKSNFQDFLTQIQNMENQIS